MTDELALKRLMDKCRICEETGCWIWTGGMGGESKCTPIFHFPGTRANKRSMAAYKAAWLLTGRKIPSGYHVYRATCMDERCVNQEHCKTGTHKMMWAHIAKSGKLKGDPRRQAIARQNLASQMTPPERVREIEAKLAEGKLRREIAAEVNVSPCVVTSVKLGRHFHASKRPQVVRGASVFAL